MTATRASSSKPTLRGLASGAQQNSDAIIPDYIKDPAAIYRESFAAVRASARLAHLPPGLDQVAVRLIHACGMPDIIDDLSYSTDLVPAAVTALLDGRPVFCDCEMVASGITRRFLPAQNDVIVTLNDARTPDLARIRHTTRSAAAVDLWTDGLDGALVAVGNAPTTLFRLLEVIAGGGPRPAAILGFAVGFIGAAESKDTLAGFAAKSGIDVPFITLGGTRGGSAMASAAVNALSLIARGDG